MRAADKAFAARHAWRSGPGRLFHAIEVERLVSNPHRGESGGSFAITACGRYIGRVHREVAALRWIAHHAAPSPRSGDGSIRELIRAIDAELTERFGRRMVVGLFVADFSGGYLGWSSNSPREDMATLLVEWLSTQEPAILQQAVERWKAQQLLGPGAEMEQ